MANVTSISSSSTFEDREPDPEDDMGIAFPSDEMTSSVANISSDLLKGDFHLSGQAISSTKSLSYRVSSNGSTISEWLGPRSEMTDADLELLLALTKYTRMSQLP